VTLFNAVGKYPCTWDLFATWAAATAPAPARVQIFTRHCVVIADPTTMAGRATLFSRPNTD
jgi:beta-ring hydroxylase